LSSWKDVRKSQKAAAVAAALQSAPAAREMKRSYATIPYRMSDDIKVQRFDLLSSSESGLTYVRHRP
jgi:hypothetical protein